MTVRTYKVKLATTTDQRKQLDTLFTDHHRAAAELERKIFAMSGEERIVDGVPINFATESEKLFPTANPKDLRNFYDDYINRKNVFHNMGFIMGDWNKDPYDHYKRLINKGVLPLINVPQTFNNRKTIIMSLFARHSSWHECDMETQKNYALKKAAFNEASKNMPQSIKDALLDFVNACGKQFGSKPENVARFINYRFVKWIRDFALPHLRVGKAVTEGYWTTFKEKKRNYYSCPPFVIDELMKRPVLWDKDVAFINHDKPMVGTVLEQYAHVLEKYTEFITYKPKSGIKTINEHTSRVTIPLGTNYRKFEFVDSEHVNIQGIDQTLTMLYKKKSGVYQLQNLAFKKIVENIKSEDGEEKERKISTSYEVTFDVNGKRHMKGRINECNIERRDDNEYYLCLTVNHEVDAQHFDAYTFFNCANGSASMRKDNNIRGEKWFKKNGLTVMGVDIGIRPLYAYSVEHFTTKGSSVITQGKLAGDYYSYNKLINRIKHVSMLLDVASDLMDGKPMREIDDECFATIHTDRATFTIHHQHFVAKGLKITDIKRKEMGWCMSGAVKLIELDFAHEKDIRRHTHKQDITSSFQFACVIKRVISLRNKFNMIGFTGGTCSKHENMWAYKDRVVEDTLDKVCRSIVDIAVTNKVHVIVLEDLDSYVNADTKESTKELKEIFCYGVIKNRVEQIAQLHGITVADVDPHDTSKMVNGEYGWRDPDHKTDIYDANLVKYDCDINAAHNIAERYMSHHTNYLSIPVLAYDNNVYTMDIKETKDKNGKSSGGERMKGLARHLLNGKRAFAIKNGAIIEGKKKGDSLGHTRLYRHHGKWVDQTTHNAIVTSISERVHAVKNEGVARSAAGT